MRDLAVLLLHLVATVARLAGPGGARSVVAESLLLKQQLLILNRSRNRSPRLRLSDRMLAGVCALLMRPRRLVRSAIVLRPSTLFLFHRALTKRTYRRLFSSHVHAKSGPKGPSQDVVNAVIDMKRRNPTWGCPRIAQQITLAFGMAINKDVVRRILAARDQPTPESSGPSWLTTLGHAKDSLWSLDLFRCESAVLPRTLGARRDGPVHPSHRGLRRTSRCRGWRGAVPNVQSRNSRRHGADLVLCENSCCRPTRPRGSRT